MKINLPIIVSFRDYHDINIFGDSLKEIIPNIKYKKLESGDIGVGEVYHAIFYKVKDKKFNHLRKEHKQLIERILIWQNNK